MLGVLAPMLAILGRSWASTDVPGSLLRPLWAVLAALERLLGPTLAILGRSWASTGGLGPLLGPLCAVLGRSWSLCWRSWAALGAYVGALGPKTVQNMATLKMCLFPERERDLRPEGRS